jgi:DNA-binding CsgD family transcriptional regulator
MAIDLLERDQLSAALDELLTQAAAGGAGHTVLVSGEAGIGKTTLVERFVERNRARVCALWGACEALFTPRPLGPLHDIARQTGGELRALLERETDRATVFAAFLEELQASAVPPIVVFEDVHWADEATLDLIKFLGRRIQQTQALFILTYRDDEIGKEHPLRFVLGDLPPRTVTRFHLPPLSEAGVAELARRAHPASASVSSLYASTGGNPFFVTEALASDTPGVPVTVRDAVLARVARLSPAARDVLDLASVVPARVEQWLIETIADPTSTRLDECLATGMLRLEEGMVAFRHELARQAVEDALSPVRRRALHTQVLHALLARAGEPIEPIQVARLVHHAAFAEQGELVLRFAPEAARQAAAQGAHREAAAHYRTALRYADALDDEQRAELLEGLSYECYLTSQMEEAARTREEALAIWRARGNTAKVGHNLRRLSRLHWFLGRNAEAERYAEEAVALLETLPPGRELAMAYANMSHLRMLASDTPGTVLWGTRAVELAEELDDYEILCYALNNIGAAEFCDGDERGRDKLERSLQIALAHGFEEHVARAYTNLAEDDVNFRNYGRAMEYLIQGLSYCAERDMDLWTQYMAGNRARMRLDQGDWAGADEDATSILRIPFAPIANRIPALLVLGRVRVRRGDPGVQTALDEALDRALSTGELQCIAPMAAARAEWRWLRGQPEQCVQEARVGFELALRQKNPWYRGELAFWMWRGGGLTEAPEHIAEPYKLQIAGDWRAAAEAWERIGCPYEQALALADGDEEAQRAALAILERLGAGPAADLVRRHLRASGARNLPRGPRPATRDNPLGLTNRQLEILLLLAEGLHNGDIAQRLSTAPKTVDHHVSAVLAKLQVRSRAEAIARAHQLGLVPTAAKHSAAGEKSRSGARRA